MHTTLALQLLAWTIAPSATDTRSATDTATADTVVTTAENEATMPGEVVETVPTLRTCADQPYGKVSQDEYVGSMINPTGDPIGGGYGYSDSGWPGPGDVIVSSALELRWALCQAGTTPGPDRIWLDPAGNFAVGHWLAYDCQGNPLGNTIFEVPDDTTLFSLRGTHVPGGPDGALVHLDSKMDGILFQVGRRVHIHGLRIQGPETGTDTADLSIGILQRDFSGRAPQPGGLEVDNCELFGWTRSAIDISGTTGAHVHHNYIHENQKDGYGYGVAIGQGADAYVIANLFDRNRHAIGADGTAGTAYEAAWNTVMAMSQQHAFDMHGRADRCGSDPTRWECQSGTAAPDAGEWMYIHHNTFLTTNRMGAIMMRGVVHQCAWIERNYFAHSDLIGPLADWNDVAVQARHVGALLSSANVSLISNRTSWSGVQWSAGGRLPWNALVPRNETLGSGVLFGDFDNDGKDDMFKVTGDGHWWFRLTGIPAAGLPADQGWFDMGPRSPGARLSDMAIGDFNGDGAADVFIANGSRWVYYPNGYGAKVDIGAHPERRSTLRFGRFDTDSKTDVFKAANGAWWYSRGGLPGWNFLSFSKVSLSELAFGDFVGDDRTDVFRAAGGVWNVSDAGADQWVEINRNSLTTSEVRLADLDGDGHTDVLASYFGQWMVWSHGAGAGEIIGSSGHALSAFAFADIDGDGASDVIFSGAP